MPAVVDGWFLVYVQLRNLLLKGSRIFDSTKSIRWFIFIVKIRVLLKHYIKLYDYGEVLPHSILFLLGSRSRIANFEFEQLVSLFHGILFCEYVCTFSFWYLPYQTFTISLLCTYNETLSQYFVWYYATALKSVLSKNFCERCKTICPQYQSLDTQRSLKCKSNRINQFYDDFRAEYKAVNFNIVKSLQSHSWYELQSRRIIIWPSGRAFNIY